MKPSLTQFGVLFSFILVLLGCGSAGNTRSVTRLSNQITAVDNATFSDPEEVLIIGLPEGSEGIKISTEEPFISHDGRLLLFNSGERENHKDLHFAELDKNQWYYRGQIGPDINRPKEVDANPSMDGNHQFYYISSGTKTFIRTGRFNPDSGCLTHIQEVAGVPEIQASFFKGSVETNMGVEVSQDGKVAFFSRATFRLKGGRVAGIVASDILFAEKTGEGFKYDEKDAETIMKNINTTDLEYAASISSDMLTLYFTRLPASALKSGNIRSEILYATRSSTSEPFGVPIGIGAIGNENFVEGPAISGDDTELFYHKRVGVKFRIYKVKRLK